MKHFLLTLFASSTFFINAQNSLNPVKWTATYLSKTATEGELLFTAIIEKNWHIYSQRATDAGPIPTSFTMVPSSDFELIGKVEETNAHEEFVTAFDAKVFVFEGTAAFRQKIKLKSKKSFSIATSLEFMTCNDKQCLPPKTIDLIVPVNVSARK